MSAVSPLPVASPVLARLGAEHAAVIDALPESVATRTARRTALAALTARGLPTGRDENWRYANLRSLERMKFTPRLALEPPSVTEAASLLPAPIAGFDRFVFVDGLFAVALSAAPGSARGVTVATQAAVDAGLGLATPDARFGALAAAFATEALAIAATADASRDIEVVFVATAAGTEAASYPHLVIDAGAQARLRVIERYVGVDDRATFSNGAVDIRVGRGAQLRHVRVQQSGAQGTHIETVRALVEADAEYVLDAVALGALAARTTLHARLADRGARIVYGSSVAIDGLQVNDTYAVVEHAAPHTETAEDYRGIAAGRSRVAFNGRIVMQANAAGSASRQSLRSLLAGPGAESDVRPQLEIYTDDVQASHGATAGKIDDDMLFYLLSRGIEARTARSLLKWAFLTELVARIAIPGLRAQIERGFAQRFTGDDAVVAQELA